MKKNLLTIMFVFSFLCFGLFVSGAKASTYLSNNVHTNSTFSFGVGKSMSRNELSKLKKFCAENICDAAIAASTQAFDDMIAACNYAENTPACHAAEQNIQTVADKTVKDCAAVGGPSAIVLQKHDIPTSNRSKGIRDDQTLGR